MKVRKKSSVRLCKNCGKPHRGNAMGTNNSYWACDRCRTLSCGEKNPQKYREDLCTESRSKCKYCGKLYAVCSEHWRKLEDNQCQCTIHRLDGIFRIECGKYWAKDVKTSTEWRAVTCKACRKAAKNKIPSNPRGYFTRGRSLPSTWGRGGSNIEPDNWRD